MTNNDIFRRLRYAVDLSNKSMQEIFALSGQEIGAAEVVAFLKKEGEEGYSECSDALLEAFLDGLITRKRGKREGEPAPARPERLTNNEILKKIRIALELKEEDMLAVFKLSQFPVSKSELSAVFRAKGHANYKECGDQMLRNFLKGLTVKHRGEDGVPLAKGPKNKPAH